MGYNMKPRKAVYHSPKRNRPEPDAVQTVPAGKQIPNWLRNAGVGSWAIIGITLVVAGVVFMTAKVSAVFIAVFVALVLTGLLNPLVNRLSKHMPRGLAVAIALLGMFLIFGGMLTFVVTSVTGQW